MRADRQAENLAFSFYSEPILREAILFWCNSPKQHDAQLRGSAEAEERCEHSKQH